MRKNKRISSGIYISIHITPIFIVGTLRIHGLTIAPRAYFGTYIATNETANRTANQISSYTAIKTTKTSANIPSSRYCFHFIDS